MRFTRPGPSTRSKVRYFLGYLTIGLTVILLLTTTISGTAASVVLFFVFAAAAAWGFSCVEFSGAPSASGRHHPQPTGNTTPTMSAHTRDRLWLAGTTVAVIALFVGVSAAMNSAQPQTQTAAYMLAALDENGTPTDSAVQDMQAALGGWTGACATETDESRADHAQVAHDSLDRHGVAESRLSILRHVRAATSDPGTAVTCADAFATYTVLRFPN